MIKCSKLLIPVLFMLPSCTLNHGDYTVLSNKIVDTRNFDMGTAKQAT